MKIKKLLPQLRKQLGFTMIELLIVIAILGILAVAVLSAINPIEQINRGRDTGSRSDAEQLISAIDRFYATKGFYPWQNGASDPVVRISWTDVNFELIADETGHGTVTANTCPVLYRLSEAEGETGCDESGALELKASFATKVDDTDNNRLFIYHGASNTNSTYVCFLPKSNNFIQEAEDRCGTDATDTKIPDDLLANYDTICPTTTDPYICLP